MHFFNLISNESFCKMKWGQGGQGKFQEIKDTTFGLLFMGDLVGRFINWQLKIGACPIQR